MNTRKIALLSVIALSLILPQGLASANTSNSGSGSSVVTSTVDGSSQSEALLNAKLSKEQAIAKIRELMPTLKDAKVEYAQLIESDTYQISKSVVIWDIQWKIGNSYRDYNGVSTQMNANTGELMSYYSYLSSQMNESYYPPKLSREEAKKSAVQFVSKVVPSLQLTNLELQDQYWDTSSSALFGPIQYSYYFNLKRNGIPSVDSVSITVDSSGNVTQYSVAIEDMNYPSAAPVISQAAAEKKLQNDFDAELYYIPITRKGALQEWILGWRPTDESIYSIDAKTGQRINYSGEQISPVSRVAAAVPKAKTVFQARTEGTEMTSKAAVQIIEKAAVIPPKRSLASQTLEKDYIDPQRKVWRLMWQDKSENVQDNYYPTQTEATVDAVSGQILEYRIDGYGLTSSQSLLPAPSKGTKLTKTSARQKAYELINALYPDASSKLKLVEYAGDDHYDKENGLYSFEFGLYVNDIPVFSGQSTISFDQYGRLMYYNADRVTDLDKITASPTPEVTKKAAIQDYLSHYKLNLKYSRSGGYYTNNNAYIEPRISLVYETEINDESGYYKALDAHSGKWVLLNDYPIYGSYTAVAEAVDIKGHWAEKELTTLLEHKIIVLDDEYRVKPEEQITTGEWLSMMVKAITPYYSGYNEYVYYGDGAEKLPIAGVKVDSIYYDVVSYAAERQWFDQNKTLQVDEKLTREQLAVLLTSIVRYDKMAAFLKQDSALNQFSDAASIQNPGAVALCVKLGLLQGQNGQFNPNGKVTRAEAAAIMMNLVKLQGKTDQAINQ